jgi:hypothetical protein
MTLTPLPAPAVLDGYFLEARSKLLDLAAILDRIDRGGGSADPRLSRIHDAVAALRESGVSRAERVQNIFSLPYDPNWKRPTPGNAQ